MFRAILAVCLLLIPVVSCHVSDFPNTESDYTVEDRISTLVRSVRSSETQPVSSLYMFLYHGFLGKVSKLVEDAKLSATDTSVCFLCRLAVNSVREYIREKKSEEELVSFLKGLCKFFRITTNRVCDGIIDQFKDELFYVVKRMKYSADEVCFLLYGSKCGSNDAHLQNWTIPMNTVPKPAVTPVFPPKENSPKMTILHITDVHIDPEYKVNSNGECGEPVCCHADDGAAPGPKSAAGKWGFYHNCDIPLQTFENMLKFIRNNLKVDFVIWTGDIPPHSVWKVTREANRKLIKESSRLIAQYLPSVTVFPALGNHEGAPVDSFPLPEVTGNQSVSWLYDELEQQWSRWLPKSQNLTIRKGAYYVIEVRPGLKIISLNMNYCNNYNLWILLNATDPTEQLQWLLMELQAAELSGEKVYIIGHIPPGKEDCLQAWSANYNNIVNRFESTIRGQFFGHTHLDEFEIFYEMEKNENRPTNVAYIAPSVTTYNSGNPAFRIYTVDGDYPDTSWAVLDHTTYILNLTKANQNNDPTWEKEYSVKEAYSLSALQPADWDDFVNRLEKDERLFNKFHWYFTKGDPKEGGRCIGECKKQLLCGLKTSKSFDFSHCV